MRQMSKISELIFKGEPHYITQNFSKAHNGTDYGTYHKNIPQYAIEDGVITYVGVDKYGSKFVKINYPRLNKTFLHGHFSEIFVTTNQKVDNNTQLGLTGMTGRATGIHLHLSIIDNETRGYLDPEVYSETYTEPNLDSNDNQKENNEYIVVAGDNLSKIAQKYQTTWETIYNNNREIIGDNQNIIYPGHKLIIK